MRLGARVGGRYELTRGPISGGMGEVWVARDLELGRKVVLKRERLDDNSSTAFDRLRAEARALAKFSHPNVVTLYDAVRDDSRRWFRKRSTFWLVLEYVPSGSLDRWPPMSPEVAARVGVQIADALAALRAEGIVHCDIKPGNIVVAADGTAKLTDFGAAYRVKAHKSITPNALFGHTPRFAAPEVIQKKPEPASDIYSLGATLHALVTGQPPKPAAAVADGQRDGGKAGDRYQAWRAAISGRVEVDEAVGPLRDVLTDMLAPDPAARPRPVEVRKRLDALADPVKLHDLPTIPPSEEGAVVGGSKRFRGGGPGKPSLAAAAAVAAVVLAAVAFITFIPDGSGDDKDPGAPKKDKATTARSLLGDSRTVDPCALADAAALARFGETELDKDYGNFDRCDVLVTTGPDSVVDVKIELSNVPAPETPTQVRTIGAIKVIEEPREGDVCDRALVLPHERPTVRIEAHETEEEGSKAPLCQIADVATARAAGVLNRGPVPRRPQPLPKQSLAQYDACALLSPDALDEVPGIDASDPDVGFGNWDCDWHSTTRDLDVSLRFDRHQPLTAEDGHPTLLRGFRAFVEPDWDGKGTCAVRTVYRTYPDEDGRPAVELVLLSVGGEWPTDRLCSLATRLSDAAAGSLR